MSLISSKYVCFHTIIYLSGLKESARHSVCPSEPVCSKYPAQVIDKHSDEQHQKNGLL